MRSWRRLEQAAAHPGLSADDAALGAVGHADHQQHLVAIDAERVGEELQCKGPEISLHRRIGGDHTLADRHRAGVSGQRGASQVEHLQASGGDVHQIQLAPVGADLHVADAALADQGGGADVQWIS
jgi:hypothetical protein